MNIVDLENCSDLVTLHYVLFELIKERENQKSDEDYILNELRIASINEFIELLSED